MSGRAYNSADAGGEGTAVQLRRALRVRLFGVEHTVTGQDDAYELTCQTNEWKPLRRGLVEVGPTVWTVKPQEDKFNGQVRLLRDAQGRWAVQGRSEFSFNRQSATLDASVKDTPQPPPVSALSGQLKVTIPADAFYFNRNVNGIINLGVRVDIKLFDQTFSDSLWLWDGKLKFELPAGRAFGHGGFKLKPLGGRVIFDPLNPSADGCRLEFDGVVVEFPGGWGLPEMPHGPLSLSGSTLSATLSRGGKEKDWQQVPDIAVEYQLAAPKLRLTLHGTGFNTHLDAGPLRVRSTALKADGNPWSSDQTGGLFNVQAGADGRVSLPFPSLSLRSPRELCEGALKPPPRWADPVTKKVYEEALNACRQLPGSPDLGSVGSIALSSLLGGW